MLLTNNTVTKQNRFADIYEFINLYQMSEQEVNVKKEDRQHLVTLNNRAMD